MAGGGFGKPIKIIKNGATFPKHNLSQSEKNQLRKKYGFNENDNILIFVGRLTKVKNLEFILKAVSLAKAQGFNFKLLFVGGGLDVNYYKNQTKILGLEKDVVFVGQVEEKAKITEYYCLADLFVMASIFDNDPLVVVEAACCGTPALVLENTGCSNRIKDNFNGFTSPYDEKKFGDRIIEVFSDKEKLTTVGQKARDTIPTTWAQTVQENIEVYHELLEKRKN